MNTSRFYDMMVDSPIHLQPREGDVLCGRSKKALSHPGNKRLRQIVSQYKEQYQRGSRPEKMRITEDILHALRSNHDSKFLKFDDSTQTWCDAGPNFAREKVSHALREKPYRPRLTKQGSSSRSLGLKMSCLNLVGDQNALLTATKKTTETAFQLKVSENEENLILDMYQFFRNS